VNPAARLVLLAPIEPASTGNGLAMRSELFRSCPPEGMSVETVVVPVAGRLPAQAARAAAATIVVPRGAQAAEGVRALAGDRTWSVRLARAGTLPPLARAASPGLAGALAGRLDPGRPVALHAMRAYMAPLALALAERVGAVWTTLDLDEDDAAFARASGDPQLAAAYERLLEVFAPHFGALSAASREEADTIGARHGLAVEHVPNAVALPSLPQRPPHDGGARGATLLFVGNLTYAPNVDAARLLAQTILPAVAHRVGGDVRLRLVGRHDRRLDDLAAADVELCGYLPDLAAVYASADAVVAPLQAAAGTRIKLLEAFAHGVPVVASSAAAAGLDVADGRQLLLAEDPEATAAAIAAVLTRAQLTAGLVARAGALVRTRYSIEAVAPRIREFFARAAGVQPEAPAPGGH